jgi:hypothetical protein
MIGGASKETFPVAAKPDPARKRAKFKITGPTMARTQSVAGAKLLDARTFPFGPIMLQTTPEEASSWRRPDL